MRSFMSFCGGYASPYGHVRTTTTGSRAAIGNRSDLKTMRGHLDGNPSSHGPLHYFDGRTSDIDRASAAR